VAHRPGQLLARWGRVRAQEIEGERERLRGSAIWQEGRGDAAQAAAEREAADALVVVMAEDVRAGLSHVPAPRRAAPYRAPLALCAVPVATPTLHGGCASMLMTTSCFPWLRCSALLGVWASCALPPGWPTRVRANLDHAPQGAAPRPGHPRAAPPSWRARGARHTRPPRGRWTWQTRFRRYPGGNLVLRAAGAHLRAAARHAAAGRRAGADAVAVPRLPARTR